MPGKLTNAFSLISIIHISGHLHNAILEISCHFNPLNVIFGHFIPIFATWQGKKICRQKNNPDSKDISRKVDPTHWRHFLLGLPWKGENVTNVVKSGMVGFRTSNASRLSLLLGSFLIEG